MKKLACLLVMILLKANLMAQIDLNDRNWKPVLHDEFTTSNRSWDKSDWYSMPDLFWRARPEKHITHGNEHQIYQYDHCIFDATNGYLKLVAECDSVRIKNHKYALPDIMKRHFPNTYGQTNGLIYFSGEIDARIPFRYGYFEIRCKLPTHQGAFPAFWLFSSNSLGNDTYYEEIDIFEYTWSLGDPKANWLPVPNPNPTYAGDPWVITTGIYHNLHGHGVDVHAETYARNYPRLSSDQENVGEWHTYSCEWMPDHVYWYLDGQLVNSYYDMAHIPQHLMTLKTNYAINSYFNRGGHLWDGQGTMTIDYIKVYQLNWDCETDEVITCQSDLAGFNYAVKKSVSITSTVNEPIVSNEDKVSFRVTDSFEITGPFEVQQGGEFTVILQNCSN